MSTEGMIPVNTTEPTIVEDGDKNLAQRRHPLNWKNYGNFAAFAEEEDVCHVMMEIFL